MGTDCDDDQLFAKMSDVDSDYVRNALLRLQYFPSIKAEGEELPPHFSSRTLSDSAVSALIGMSKPKKPDDWKYWVEIRTRRYDGLIRRLGIPHPVSHAKLVDHIAENWSDIEPAATSERSGLSPSYSEDGRLLIMDYGDSANDQLHRQTILSQGKKYMVVADISNCFPSIYTHSIDWALRGKSVAKSSHRSKTWQTRLDKLTQDCTGGETKGLLIGPATSNLLAEIVLKQVDEMIATKLMPRGSVEFTRYVDDYSAYCRDINDAEAFIATLEKALSAYKLQLNTKKTKIIDLSSGFDEEWRERIHAALPKKIDKTTVPRFFRNLERLAIEFPNKSVMKYGVKTILDQVIESGALVEGDNIIDEFLRIVHFHPHMLPFLAKFFDSSSKSISEALKKRATVSLLAVMERAALRGETDTILWCLYIIRISLRQSITKSHWMPLLNLNDDMVTVAVVELCKRSRTAAQEVVRGREYSPTGPLQPRPDGELSYPSEFERDEHWLARYELWRRGILLDAHLSESELKWMGVLRRSGVAFCGE